MYCVLVVYVLCFGRRCIVFWSYMYCVLVVYVLCFGRICIVFRSYMYCVLHLEAVGRRLSCFVFLCRVLHLWATVKFTSHVYIIIVY